MGKAAAKSVTEGLGVGRHVLDNSRLSAFHPGDCVLVIAGAGIDIHGLFNGRSKVSLGGLPGQIGAGNFDL